MRDLGLMNRRKAAAALLFASLFSGCGIAFEAPPLEIGYRDSLLGAGKIVRIENTSNGTLDGLEVRIEAPSGEERTFRHERLGPYEVLEVGWKKLGGWEVPAGARVRVRCGGFLLPFKAELPRE